MKDLTLAATAIVAIATLAACNTIGGVAKDTYGAGKFVTKQVTKDRSRE